MSVKDVRFIFIWLLTTKGHNMAAVFVHKFPGDGFLHNLLHLLMTQQMSDDWFINMLQFAHTQSAKVLVCWLCDEFISENSYEYL